jgi:hypothetical protein
MWVVHKRFTIFNLCGLTAPGSSFWYKKSYTATESQQHVSDELETYT